MLHSQARQQEANQLPLDTRPDKAHHGAAAEDFGRTPTFMAIYPTCGANFIFTRRHNQHILV